MDNDTKATATADGPLLQVLLVEDGLVNQLAAAGFLERAGHHVTVAENGEVALRYWETQPFDIIFMDVQMPVMDGIEATDLIRQREAATGKRIPIVAMTAADMEGDKERCLAAGMDDFISKPISPQTLATAIAKQLRGVATTEPQLSAEVKFDENEIVDFDTALTLVPGGEHVLKDLARIFLMECPKLVKDLRQGLADDDVEATQRAAHTLKGAARILAANRLSKLSSELERLARDKQLDAIRARLEEAEHTVAQACDRIKAWRG